MVVVVVVFQILRFLAIKIDRILRVIFTISVSYTRLTAVNLVTSFVNSTVMQDELKCHRQKKLGERSKIKSRTNWDKENSMFKRDMFDFRANVCIGWKQISELTEWQQTGDFSRRLNDTEESLHSETSNPLDIQMTVLPDKYPRSCGNFLRSFIPSIAHSFRMLHFSRRLGKERFPFVLCRCAIFVPKAERRRAKSVRHICQPMIRILSIFQILRTNRSL